MKKVLIMEDELNIRSFVVINLKRAGYDAIEAGNGQEALDAIAQTPDIGVAILDIMVPGDMDGFEVCRRIRASNKQMGIIMLTARTQEMDKVTGLMTGADDYVTKPFSPAELTARIDALYRRIGGDSSASSELLTQGPFVMNTRNHTLEKNGNRIRLTQVEYAILKLFMQNPGRALSREDILSAVWGRDYGRAEDRGREHPPSPPENRGRYFQSHLYHHGLGSGLQVGRLTRNEHEVHEKDGRPAKTLAAEHRRRCLRPGAGVRDGGNGVLRHLLLLQHAV